MRSARTSRPSRPEMRMATMARPEPSLASAKWPGDGPRRSAMAIRDQGCSRDQARDLGFQVGAGEGGAGERNRIPTISLGIRQIRAADRPELGIRCTASDRESPSDTGLMARQWPEV